MITTAEVFDLVERYRKQLGLSQAEVAQRAFGQDSSAAIQGLRRGKSPGIERLSAICDAVGLELYLGPPRAFAQAESETLGGNNEEFVKVRRYDVKLSAGPGLNGDNSAPLAPVAFRAAWMTSAGLIADKCCVLGVQGDSMRPTLSDGDLVLVDERQTTLRDRSVYAFVDVTGDARIKRLERLDDQLLIRSDNPDHAIEIRKPAEANLIRLIGKVVWSGHSWR